MPVSRRECRIKRVSNLPGPAQQLDLFGGETPRGHSGHTSVAGTVGGDTGDADRSDCAADVGACRREPARIAETDLVMISDKVRSHHLERRRCSTPAIVSASGSAQPRERCVAICHAESPAELDLSEIEVIDDDLGCSAAGGVQRAGFERMVAEVRLGRLAPYVPAKSRASPATGGLAAADRDVPRCRYCADRSAVLART